MWRPTRTGQVIAERQIDFKSKAGRVRRVRLRFGLPVRDPDAKRGDPWWCPIEVKGAGLDSFRAIAGVDSFQALILALEFVSNVLPSEAARRGGRLAWLGDSERVVLGTHALSRATESAVLVLVGNLKAASDILAGPRANAARTRAMRALDALAELGGLSRGGTGRKKRKPAGRDG